MACTNTLGIVADRQCFKNPPSGKTWFDVRSFTQRYWQFLGARRLLVSGPTKAILLEVARQLKTPTGTEAQFRMEDLGNASDALTNIANRRPGEIEEILLFMDPMGLLHQLAMMRLEVISVRGHRVRLNFGAALWAEHARKSNSAMVVQQYSEIHPAESLVLVEENATVPMFNFIAKHIDAIKLFPQLVLTKAVRAMVEILFDRNQIRVKDRPRLMVPNHPQGELFGIANLILTDSYNIGRVPMQPALGARFDVVAFTDYQRDCSPGIEMQKFLEVCADPRLRVNLLMNKQTAEEWCQQFELPNSAFGTSLES